MSYFISLSGGKASVGKVASGKGNSSNNSPSSSNSSGSTSTGHTAPKAGVSHQLSVSSGLLFDILEQGYIDGFIWVSCVQSLVVPSHAPKISLVGIQSFELVCGRCGVQTPSGSPVKS